VTTSGTNTRYAKVPTVVLGVSGDTIDAAAERDQQQPAMRPAAR
jgi:hypothetical protein